MSTDKMRPADRIIRDIEFLCLFDPEFVRDWEIADIGIDWVLNECSKLGDISAQTFVSQHMYPTTQSRSNLTKEQKSILRHCK